jgi:MFS family permease
LALIAAFLGWLFDGLEIGLFPVVARPALQSMLAESGEAGVADWMGRITAGFLIGAACGGALFGWLGDRLGRVRAMALSILAYAVFSGAGFLASEPWQLAVLRFLAALGMGGEWALGVALVMEAWPERWRPMLAGAIGAAANVGFLLVALIAWWFPVTVDSWRWMFLVGALPALLAVFVIWKVPESRRWQAVRGSALSIHPFREIFGPALRHRTLIGIALASVALIGTWGSVQWLPLWVDQLTAGQQPGAKASVQVMSSVGAVIGCLIAPIAGRELGRRPAYCGLCLLSWGLCFALFRYTEYYSPRLLLFSFAVGGATAAFYGWFPLYLPELFPTRVRATGQGVSYNAGRLFAAWGALLSGQLVSLFNGSYAQAGLIITLVYLLGAVLIWFAPETKGQPLPD